MQLDSSRGSKQLAPHGTQVTHHVDQRNAVQAGGQLVEQVGGLGVIERAELLQFPQPDREDVAERRFIHAGQEMVQQRDRQVGSLGRLNHQILHFVRRAAAIQMAVDLQAARGRVDVQGAAGAATVDRGQVPRSPIGREPVQHAADELHQGRLARLVGAKDNRHTMGQSLQTEFGPHTESIHLEVLDFHRASSLL